MYILQFYLHFQHLENNTIAYMLGIELKRLNKIVKQWKINDKFIIIDSKMNYIK